MASYLIDAVLLLALVVTALRSHRLHGELKKLREAGPDFGATIGEVDRSINRAAEAVVSLKHEGVQTVSALEARIAEAAETARRLDDLVARADWHVTRRANAAARRPAPAESRETAAFGERMPHASLAG